MAWVIVPTLLRHRLEPAPAALLGFIAISVALAAMPAHALVTAGSGGAASGSVVFTNDTQPLATVNLRNGLARFSTDALAVGGHRIRARFVPNGMFEGSSSHLRQLVRNQQAAGSP